MRVRRLSKPVASSAILVLVLIANPAVSLACEWSCAAKQVETAASHCWSAVLFYEQESAGPSAPINSASYLESEPSFR